VLDGILVFRKVVQRPGTLRLDLSTDSTDCPHFHALATSFLLFAVTQANSSLTLGSLNFYPFGLAS